jgi:hypothetical protein
VLAMAKKFIVDLDEDEAAELVALTQKSRPGSRKIKQANIKLYISYFSFRNEFPRENL